MDTIAILTIIISLLTICMVVYCLLRNAKYKGFSLYWVVGIIGAILLLLINIKNIWNILGAFIENSSINPIKILIFFISMTILSIILDNLKFFNYLATKCARLAKNSQFKLFLMFYCLVSVLTIFTSNDIIILAFVPFICYFCKNNNINPIPYVFSTFVGANTWSMLFVIGNPTNVYVASYAGIDFITYFLKMAIPTLICGVVSFLMLVLIFKKQLKQNVEVKQQEHIHINKLLVGINAGLLLVCTLILAISSYLNLEMWYIALGFAVVALFVNLVVCAINKLNKEYIFISLKKAPWEFVPFLISMFILVRSLDINQITYNIAQLFTFSNSILSYGVLSFLFSNIMNNIPMTAFFTSILAQGGGDVFGVYAIIIGSNLGAILTPIGALAGIMFLNILKEKDIEFSIAKFIKYGIIISGVLLFTTLLAVWII